MPPGATIAIDGPQMSGAISQPFANECTTFVTAVHTRYTSSTAHQV